MNYQVLKEQWKAEERVAHIQGWDFLHIQGRYEAEQDLPWDYRAIVRNHLTPDLKLLDVDTGGGEFLLSLRHSFSRTSATEGYPPNVEMCKKVLLPLGIDFHEAADVCHLPFPDGSFDRVINRHGDFDALELFRILKPAGIYITEQVGAENDREFVDLLLPCSERPFPEQYLEKAVEKFEQAGFKILEAQEAFRPIRFYDVGALVWFARIIEWEFPSFSVDRCFEQLSRAQQILEKNGLLEGKIHRFLLIAQKST